MKLYLRKLLIKALQPFGFYITFYSSIEKIYNVLEQKSVSVQEFELKRIFDAVAIANNHKYYSNLLKRFINEWNLEILSAEFVGVGAGSCSLSSYRKVKIKQEMLHEKVYFSSHHEMAKIFWFQKNLAELVADSGIVLPPVYKIFNGEILTVVYSEYLNLKKLTFKKKQERLIEFSNQLYQLSSTENYMLICQNAPKSIKDFTQHFEYKRNRLIVKNLLSEHNISLENLELSVGNSRHVLAHGDIQDTNAFQNNILIDWDSVGIFPLGLDPAFILFYLMLNNEWENNSNVLNWIEINYGKIINPKEWRQFQFNITYFLFVFIQGRIPKERREHLENGLILFLKTNILIEKA